MSPGIRIIITSEMYLICGFFRRDKEMGDKVHGSHPHLPQLRYEARSAKISETEDVWPQPDGMGHAAACL